MRRSIILHTIGTSIALSSLVAMRSEPRSGGTLQQAPVFTSRTDLVTLDVSVLNKLRQPVRGLTAADFSVKEDGKPQQVVLVHQVDVDEQQPVPVKWMQDVAPDVTTNTIEDSRLVVIVIDDALIPMDPRITKDTKQIVGDIIARLSPSDYAAIVFTAEVRKAQDFTHDRALLRAAADSFTGGIASYTFGWDSVHPEDAIGTAPQVNPDSHYYGSVVRTLTNISEYLIVAPNRRKALIWISPGVPVDLAGAGPMQAPKISGAVPGFSGKPTATVPDLPTAPLLADHEIMARFLDDTRELLRQAQRANVVIYPIDPTGLGGLERYIGNHAPPREPAEVPRQKARLSLDFVESAAANTGGRALVNTNDFGPGIDQIFRENSSYYLVGFRPTNLKEDGGFRRVEVTVNRPDAEVHARSGYYTSKAGGTDAAKKSPVNALLAKAIGGILPATDLPLGVSLAPFALPQQRAAAILIVMGVRQPIPAEAVNKRVTQTTELQVTAFAADGSARSTQRNTATVVLRQGATGDARYEVLGRIDLPPGRYRLRLAAHNTDTGRTGSVPADVVVPDFTNDAFSMSGIVIGLTPAVPSAPKNLLSSIVPLVPTAEREFTSTDRAVAFLRLYQSGSKSVSDLSLMIRIADSHGGFPVDETRLITADKFYTQIHADQQDAPPPIAGAGVSISRGRGSEVTAAKVDPFANVWLRTSDINYSVPVSRLAPGPYLLTFQVTLAGITQRRDVRIAVR